MCTIGVHDQQISVVDRPDPSCNRTEHGHPLQDRPRNRVAESTLCRFMGRKGGLSLDALDRLGEYLRLTVALAPQRPNGRKGR